MLVLLHFRTDFTKLGTIYAPSSILHFWLKQQTIFCIPDCQIYRCLQDSLFLPQQFAIWYSRHVNKIKLTLFCFFLLEIRRFWKRYQCLTWSLWITVVVADTCTWNLLVRKQERYQRHCDVLRLNPFEFPIPLANWTGRERKWSWHNFRSYPNFWHYNHTS